MHEVELNVNTGPIREYVRKFPKAQKAGLLRVANHAQVIAVRKVTAIRRRRVPTKRQVAEYKQKKRKSKRKLRALTVGNDPAWTPTGNLAKSVEAEPIFEGEDIVKLEADLPYAASREGLGVTWTPKEPAIGIIRKDPFFSETADIVAPQTARLFWDGWREEMPDDAI